MKLSPPYALLFAGAVLTYSNRSSPASLPGTIRTRADLSEAYFELYEPPPEATYFLSVVMLFTIPRIDIPQGQPMDQIYAMSFNIDMPIPSKGQRYFGFTLQMMVDNGVRSYYASVPRPELDSVDAFDLENFLLDEGDKLGVRIAIRPEGTSSIRVENLTKELGHVVRFPQSSIEGASAVKWSLGKLDADTRLGIVPFFHLGYIIVQTDIGILGDLRRIEGSVIQDLSYEDLTFLTLSWSNSIVFQAV